MVLCVLDDLLFSVRISTAAKQLAAPIYFERNPDAVLATNESYKEIAIARGRVPPGRVFVVRSGPSLERVRSVPPDERLKCGRRFLVGYVGVMGEQEGIDCLLQAVRHIVHDLKRTDIHFALVGGGTSLAEMQALAVRLPERKRSMLRTV